MIKKKVTSPSFVKKKKVVRGQFIEEETEFLTYI